MSTLTDRVNSSDALAGLPSDTDRLTYEVAAGPVLTVVIVDGGVLLTTGIPTYTMGRGVSPQPQ